MTEERRGRGRPRPEFTKTRDDAVYAYLNENGPQNRVGIAAWLAVNVNIVYLSLCRLRRDGKVTTRKAGKYHVWSAVP